MRVTSFTFGLGAGAKIPNPIVWQVRPAPERDARRPATLR